MISIKEATISDINSIQEIAVNTWPFTYGAILSKAQLEYMLDKFYNYENLNTILKSSLQKFIMVYDERNFLGFASYEHHYLSQNTTRVHKIYVLPEAQGKGAGTILMNAIVSSAHEKKAEIITLNVNRSNIALHFYLKLGFEITGQEDVALDYGYLMEDYKMELKIC